MTPMGILGLVLISCDLTFPLWWILLLIYLLRRGLKAWQAWGITSLMGTTMLYIITGLIEFGIGRYPLLFLASIPYLFQEDYYKGMQGDKYFTFWFWTMPPLFIIAIPTALLYWSSRVKAKKVDEQQERT